MEVRYAQYVKNLPQTVTRVDVLMAAVESLTKALAEAEQRIKTLEELVRPLELRRPSTRNGGTSRST